MSAATLPPTQFAYRSAAGIGLSEGAPAFGIPAGFEKQIGNARVLQYSKNGQYLAWATPESVKVMDAQSLQIIQDFSIKDVLEIDFSPKGTFLSTWQRQIKTEDGSHRNMAIYDVKTGQEFTSFSQKSQNNWNVQWTDDETYCARMVSNEVHFWEPKNLTKTPFTKLIQEGMSQFSLSPGKSTCVAVFFGERKGAPAMVRIYSITNFAVPLASKSFFKADRVQMIWNQLGTNVLVWATTDHDKTGKSYYGETNLYYLSVAGNFDCRVPIDGLIHDVAWAPASKDFVVIHGQMPNPKTTLFDHRANAVHEFGRDARNTIKWNPQGRILVLAGFGNLAGTMDFWDRKTLKKIASVSARDTTACEWSPDGRHILTATLSPRLRVDNGYKIWHYTGVVVHTEEINELYQVAWRPCSPDVYPIRSALSPAPQPTANVSVSAVKPAPVRMGAYRPPQARGTPAPSLFVDASSSSSTAAAAAADANLSKAALKNKKKRENAKKSKDGEDAPAAGSGNSSPVATPARSNTPRPNSGSSNNSNNKAKAQNGALLPATTASNSQMTETEKKIRNVTKKLKQIHELKEKQAAGETLELTQLQKITAEATLLKELEALKI
ncbi:translation initiation factor 2A [Entomortierella parvispora]|uniref:Eukaryotic translation initiation factor 2A n=1 Tax=Entomortierella parvispora TaxID=205924 RepID=A0A9P3HI00_9FUNG|nr:translation initiation factor 2A [Entomortierella parvispora]